MYFSHFFFDCFFSGSLLALSYSHFFVFMLCQLILYYFAKSTGSRALSFLVSPTWNSRQAKGCFEGCVFWTFRRKEDTIISTSRCFLSHTWSFPFMTGAVHLSFLRVSFLMSKGKPWCQSSMFTGIVREKRKATLSKKLLSINNDSKREHSDVEKVVSKNFLVWSRLFSLQH